MQLLTDRLGFRPKPTCASFVIVMYNCMSGVGLGVSFTGRTHAEAEASVLWPPDVKSQLIGKDPDARKD